MSLLAPTRVLDWPSQRTMFDESYAALRLRRDPLLELAFALDDELRAAEQRQEHEEGVISLLRPAWMRAVHAFLATPVSPDANGTLRVSLGHILGYSPRDGVAMLPQTTLRGLLAKVGDAPPFALPEGSCRPPDEGGPGGGRMRPWGMCQWPSWPTSTPRAAPPGRRCSTAAGSWWG